MTRVFDMICVARFLSSMDDLEIVRQVPATLHRERLIMQGLDFCSPTENS